MNWKNINIKDFAPLPFFGRYRSPAAPAPYLTLDFIDPGRITVGRMPLLVDLHIDRIRVVALDLFRAVYAGF